MAANRDKCSPWSVTRLPCCGLFLVVLLLFPLPSTAPLPPCTPFLFLNKMIEANNWSSDMNPYYPVRVCPYRNPRNAPLHMQFAIFNDPMKNLYHVGKELSWLFGTGIPRGMRMLMGREKFRVDNRILNEGYHSHYPGRERTRHFGRNTRKSRAYYRRRRRST